MENENQFFVVEAQDKTEITDILPKENNRLDEQSRYSEQQLKKSSSSAQETTAVKKEEDTELSLLSRVEHAYNSLQDKFTKNQQLLLESRSEIMALRLKINKLTTDVQINEDKDALHKCKLLAQDNNCTALISHAEQIREHLYNNSNHAISLLIPLKANVDLLELRLQHIQALESFLENVKVGLEIQDRLLEIDLVIESLASKLEII